jgi:hypothetical protein
MYIIFITSIFCQYIFNSHLITLYINLMTKSWVSVGIPSYHHLCMHVVGLVTTAQTFGLPYPLAQKHFHNLQVPFTPSFYYTHLLTTWLPVTHCNTYHSRTEQNLISTVALNVPNQSVQRASTFTLLRGILTNHLCGSRMPRLHTVHNNALVM